MQALAAGFACAVKGLPVEGRRYDVEDRFCDQSWVFSLPLKAVAGALRTDRPVHCRETRQSRNELTAPFVNPGFARHHRYCHRHGPAL
jgi:hypothetical protein